MKLSRERRKKDMPYTNMDMEDHTGFLTIDTHYCNSPLWITSLSPDAWVTHVHNKQVESFWFQNTLTRWTNYTHFMFKGWSGERPHSAQFNKHNYTHTQYHKDVKATVLEHQKTQSFQCCSVRRVQKSFPRNANISRKWVTVIRAGNWSLRL